MPELRFITLSNTKLHLKGKQRTVKCSFRKELLKPFDKKSWSEHIPQTQPLLKEIGVFQFLNQHLTNAELHPLCGSILEFKNKSDLLMFTVKYRNTGESIGYGGYSNNPIPNYYHITEENYITIEKLIRDLNELQYLRQKIKVDAGKCLEINSNLDETYTLKSDDKHFNNYWNKLLEMNEQRKNLIEYSKQYQEELKQKYSKMVLNILELIDKCKT